MPAKRTTKKSTNSTNTNVSHQDQVMERSQQSGPSSSSSVGQNPQSSVNATSSVAPRDSLRSQALDQIKASGFFKPASGQRHIILDQHVQREEEPEEPDHGEGTSAGPSTSGTTRKRATPQEEEEQIVPAKASRASDQRSEEAEPETDEQQQAAPVAAANEEERRDERNLLGNLIKIWLPNTPADLRERATALGGVQIPEGQPVPKLPKVPTYTEENDCYEPKPPPNGKRDYLDWTPEDFALWARQVMSSPKGEQMAQKIIAERLEGTQLERFSTNLEEMKNLFDLNLSQKLKAQVAAIPYINYRKRLVYERKVEIYEEDLRQLYLHLSQ